MKNWRKSPRAAIAATAVIALIQLGIPTSLLEAASVPRFGWQMFSTGSRIPAFEVVTEAGTESVSLDDYMARVRDEIDGVAHLPPHLCNVIPGAERILWDTGEWKC
ncbi:MAG: hypothetical protein ACRDVL_07625 [Acidimicrobiia bacterium]